jgi:hypothetical protein
MRSETKKKGKNKMKDTVTAYQFVNEMAQSQHGFSREGARALFEYFEAYEEDTGEQMEFDPVAIRCDFDEYENLKAIQENYQDIETLEDLQNHTTVIEIPNSDRLIIQAY